MDLILPSFSWLFSQRKKKSAANGPCMTQISQNIDNIVFVLTAILFTKENIYIYIYLIGFFWHTRTLIIWPRP